MEWLFWDVITRLALYFFRRLVLWFEWSMRGIYHVVPPAMKLEPPFSFQTATSRKVCWRSLQSVPKFKNVMWVRHAKPAAIFFRVNCCNSPNLCPLPTNIHSHLLESQVPTEMPTSPVSDLGEYTAGCPKSCNGADLFMVSPLLTLLFHGMYSRGEYASVDD